jgi:hypothetical protein
MSTEAKRIKILTLVAMAVGLVCVIVPIVLWMQSAPAALAGLLGAEGAITIIYGGRGALIANVPARIGQLVKLSLIVCVVQAALIGCMIMVIGQDHIAENPLAIGCAAVPFFISLIICLLSRGMAKRAER